MVGRSEGRFTDEVEVERDLDVICNRWDRRLFSFSGCISGEVAGAVAEDDFLKRPRPRLRSGVVGGVLTPDAASTGELAGSESSPS